MDQMFVTFSEYPNFTKKNLEKLLHQTVPTSLSECVTYKGLMDFKHYAFTFAFTLHCPLPYSPTEIIPSNNSTFIALHYKM